MENNNENVKDMNMHRPHCKMHIIALVLSITSIIFSSFTLGYTITNKQTKHMDERERRFTYSEEIPFKNNDARPFFESKGPSSENKGMPFSNNQFGNRQFDNKQFGNFPSFRKDDNNNKENGINDNK